METKEEKDRNKLTYSGEEYILWQSYGWFWGVLK